MQLTVLHYHFRPGGVRRVIEQGLPALIRAAGLTRVVMLAGESADQDWRRSMEQAVFPCDVAWLVAPALGYWAEQTIPACDIRAAIRETLCRVAASDSVLWVHNLSVGRNMLLAQELVALPQNSTVWLHHHDWWWDGRWERWPEMNSQGITSLEEAASLTLPSGPQIIHFCVNAGDARGLRAWTGMDIRFLPNPLVAQVSESDETEQARKFLRDITGTESCWVYPCRGLRRKNIAEALLVQRWLDPDAAVVTTGAPSSDAEFPCVEALGAAALQNNWPLHMGVCRHPCAPSVPSLISAADTVAVTSLREGFGLVYHEAAAASRPLVARVPNGLGETLQAIGFQFSSAWNALQIPRQFYDESAESRRTAEGRSRLKALLPPSLHPALEMHNPPYATTMDFGRLSLTAQIEVLSHPPDITHRACLPLNPVLSRPRSVQPPAAADWSPDLWAHALLLHARKPHSAPACDPDWPRRIVSVLTPQVHSWLSHPLLWESIS
jgi:hypothetical protein